MVSKRWSALSGAVALIGLASNGAPAVFATPEVPASGGVGSDPCAVRADEVLELREIVRAKVACNFTGRRVRHRGIDFVVPSSGRRFLVEEYRESDRNVSFAVRQDGLRKVHLEEGPDMHQEEHAPDETEQTDAGNSGRGTGCSQTAWAHAGWTAHRGYAWTFNRSTSPLGDQNSVQNAFVAAADTWRDVKNPCGVPDYYPFDHWYLGNTTRRANVTLNGCSNADGHSVVSFRNLPAGVLGRACRFEGPNGSLGEGDFALTTRASTWTLDPTNNCRNRYDVQSVATHEFGHLFGLGHPPTANNELTMHRTMSPCSKAFRDLGRGDADGINRR